jgi:hypothetical protein
MRPTRTQLNGMSPSQFKTMLKRKGHTVPRNFFKYGCVSTYRNRLYRWRHWASVGFVVDISCLIPDFDRWANSTDDTLTFDEWKLQ